jgi:hypothetical protein
VTAVIVVGVNFINYSTGSGAAGSHPDVVWPRIQFLRETHLNGR